MSSSIQTSGEIPKVISQKAKQSKSLWFDSRKVSNQRQLFSRMKDSYSGVLIDASEKKVIDSVPSGTTKVIVYENTPEISEVITLLRNQSNVVVASHNDKFLEKIQSKNFKTCLRVNVVDAESLSKSIELGKKHDYVMIRFKDPTNIPLELVIASLQFSNTNLIKEISLDTDVEDAIVSLGVMEIGADGIMFTPQKQEDLLRFLNGIEKQLPKINIEVATITKSTPIGMGHRSCIDLTTLFEPNEGMIVGSTSNGGILCCPEVFFLPYMELRPFRVNAGAIHSYVFNLKDRTSYMSELKAGDSVMISDQNGIIRAASVGRIKTEVRPLRLIEATFGSGKTINTIMQDDWHVRVFSDDAKPFNITELKKGSKILAHPAEAGRHVGIKINEAIKEC